MTYAILTDVSTRLGRPISDQGEMAQVNAWLDDVEALIEARFKRSGLVLADQIGLDDPSLATVVRVESDVVIRRIYQPQPGRTSVTRSVDDASVTDRWEGQTADAGLTVNEWADLLPSVSSGAFSTRPRFEPDAASAQVW